MKTPDNNSGAENPPALTNAARQGKIDQRSMAALRKIKDDFASFAEEKEREYLPQMLDKFAEWLPDYLTQLTSDVGAEWKENPKNIGKPNRNDPYFVANNLLRETEKLMTDFTAAHSEKDYSMMKALQTKINEKIDRLDNMFIRQAGGQLKQR